MPLTFGFIDKFGVQLNWKYLYEIKGEAYLDLKLKWTCLKLKKMVKVLLSNFLWFSSNTLTFDGSNIVSSECTTTWPLLKIFRLNFSVSEAKERALHGQIWRKWGKINAKWRKFGYLHRDLDLELDTHWRCFITQNSLEAIPKMIFQTEWNKCIFCEMKLLSYKKIPCRVLCLGEYGSQWLRLKSLLMIQAYSEIKYGVRQNPKSVRYASSEIEGDFMRTIS